MQSMENREPTNPKLIRCPYCEAVNIDTGKEVHCHRCGSKIAHQPKHSLSISWAFLIAAMILYIPANIFPVLEIKTIFSYTQNTIIGGVISLWDDGSHLVAIIILIASVFVPILKFILLLYLFISAKHGVNGNLESHHRLFRFVEMIGPWSMVDIFVVTILAGLVRYNDFKIVAGEGATAFVLMVFFTTMAAYSFDIRFLYKKQEN